MSEQAPPSLCLFIGVIFCLLLTTCRVCFSAFFVCVCVSSCSSRARARCNKQALPYNLAELTWNRQHTRNAQQIYCYCQSHKDTPCIQCHSCRQWFHTDCVQVLEGQEGNILPFQRNCQFLCSVSRLALFHSQGSALHTVYFHIIGNSETMRD